VIATDIVGDEVDIRTVMLVYFIPCGCISVSSLLQYHWIGAQEKRTHGHITPDMFMCMMEHAYDLTID
jgi:hypothetical protein